MTTKKAYLEDTALDGDAVVTGIAANGGVRLDRTLFHAQGGGQRADTGTIAGHKVVDVRHAEDGEVDHMLEGGAVLDVGATVHMDVDPQIRLLHARLHTAGHLIAYVVSSIAPGLTAKAGHHWPAQARVDFETAEAYPEGFLSGLEAALADHIAADLPVRRVGDPHSSRAIEIGSFGAVGCGGTHVGSLAAIGSISIRRVQRKQGLIRVSYSVAGEPG